jgi:threonine/homoserine/homoserine lactone efflux protein
MISIELVLPVASAFLIVTASPGPANIAAAMVAMRFGRSASLVFGLGLGIGLAFWGVIAATGLGVILQGSAKLLFALKIIGGLYLLWLACQSWRSAAGDSLSVKGAPTEGRWFLRGLLLNLSNPKAVFAWMAALSMGLGGGSAESLVIVPTVVCIAIGFLNYALYALAFSLAGFMAGYNRIRKWVDGVVGALFAIAGLSLVRSAFSR